VPNRAWLAPAVVVLLAGALAACSEDSPRLAEGQTSCGAVMHIGDSLTVGMMAEGQIADPALRLDSQYRAVGVADVHGDGGVGRTIHEVSNDEQPGAEVARQARADGYTGCWVVELGTNDVALLAQNETTFGPRQRIDEMMAIIGDEPVMWLTTVTQVDDGDYDSANMEAWNAILRDARDSYPNMVIYDWASVARPEWFHADGVHSTPTGFTEMARLIPTELAELLPATR
jgi:lysophospholipase L1-like esterase